MSKESIVKEYKNDKELRSCKEVMESEGLTGAKANKYQIKRNLALLCI